MARIFVLLSVLIYPIGLAHKAASADIHIEDQDGATALWFAQDKKHEDIIAILKVAQEK